VNPTESYYYSPADKDGLREDIEQRPELIYGTVDFLASMEYMNRPPMPPTYVFLFDVSQPALDSGYLQQATHTIKSIIEEGTLPGGDRARVCFLAYDKNLYFFNLRSTLKQP
jgi:protein transport protein SEC24